MEPQTQPFQQKLRKMHPKLEPTVKKELNKLLTTKMIYLIFNVLSLPEYVSFNLTI
jgi:hypothetical protein